MSTTTTNYNLIKPELTDAADITAMNENWDKLDAELKRQADSTPDVSGQIEAHNKSDKSHQDIRSAVNKSLADAKSYTDEKIAEIPAPDTSKIDNHINNKNNPHKVTASQVGALPIDGSKPITGNELGLDNGNGSIYSDEKCVRLITKDKPNDNSSMRYIEVLNPDASDEEYCVQLVTIGDPEYGDLSRCIFGEHNLSHTRDVLFNGSAEELSAMATALGAGQIKTGSYKGNDATSWSVTVGFKPKVFVIKYINPNNSQVYWTENWDCFPSGKMDNANNAHTCSFTSTGVSCKAPNTYPPCNLAGITYYWYAIG